MKDSKSQQIARQQVQYQIFLEKSKKQIIQAERTHILASTPMGYGGSGMIRSCQYSIPSESDLSSTPRPHVASGWTLTAQQSSSSNQPAAEAFLRGNRNTRIAYNVLNKDPRTLNDALE